MSIRFSAKWAAAILIAGALSGCNKLKLGYEYADWLVSYSVEENFDLDKGQRAGMKADVAEYFRWHRARMLPLYADYLTYVAERLRAGLAPEAIDSGYARYQALYKMTLAPIAEKSANLLMALSPEQVDAWLDLQKKKNQKLRKDFGGTLDERLGHRYGKIVDELEDWTGRLNKEQKAKIKSFNATMPWNGMLWLETREKVQEHLAELLKRKAGRNEVRDYLNTYYLETDSLRSEEYRIKNREFEIRLRGVIYLIHNILTPGQKLRAIQQVEKLAQDLRAWSKPE